MKKRDTNLKELEENPRGLVGESGQQPGVRHQRFEPPKSLAHVLEHIWNVEWKLAAPMTQQVVAHPSFHLVWESGIGRWVVHGPRSELFKRVTEGQGFVVGVKFLPGMARRLVESPKEWKNKDEVCATPLLKPFTSSLAHFVADLPSAMPHLLAPPSSDEELACNALRSALDNHALVTTADLAKECNVSIRKLQRVFGDHVGLSPKAVLMIYRMHEALHALQAGHSLVEIAMRLEYSDQAHFSRDFRRVIGQSPGAYAKKVARFQDE